MALGLMLLAGCINEDLSKCGVNYAVRYEMRLSATLEQALQQEFVTAQEQALAQQLRQALGRVLTDRARVMDLSFFTADAAGQLVRHERLTPDANQTSVTVYMNRADYYTVALAATEQVGATAAISGADAYGRITLRQAVADTVSACPAALFMGLERLRLADAAAGYRVALYMVNAVPVLLVDGTGSTAHLQAAYVRGTASGIHCADSLYQYDRSAVVRTERVEHEALTALYSVCFPSVERADQRQNYTEAEGSLWEFEAYTRTADGRTVRNTLYVRQPLRAATMRVIKVKLQPDGSLTSGDPEVGVSVELDWKPGGDHDVEI